MCVCIIKAQNHEANEKVSELEQRPLRRETKIWLPGERPWNPEAAERGQRADWAGQRGCVRRRLELEPSVEGARPRTGEGSAGKPGGSGGSR